MLNRLKAAIVVPLVLAWPGPRGLAQPGPSCVQSGIAAGGDHTCAFTSPGSAMCWGDNSFGQNGNGTFNTPTLPPTVVVPGLAPATIAPNLPHQLIAGNRHTCTILLPGYLFCSGDDSSGQLGDGRSGTGVDSSTEIRVVDSNGQPLRPVIAVAAGGQHSCAVVCPNLPACEVRCWGDNQLGQLGNGSTGGMSATSGNPLVFPSTPGGLSTPNPIDISAGSSHICAVMEDNTARCWGANGGGQIGNCGATGPPVNSPATVIMGGCPTTVPLPDVVQIAAGESHTCALLSGPVLNTTGNVACWGTGPEGELGNPGTLSSPNPVAVVDSSGVPNSRLTGVQEIAAGSFHTCALIKSDGSVQCWGSNSNGQLGPAARGNCRGGPAGTVSCSEFPVPVTIDAAGNTPLSGVTHIAAGASHTCATLSAGGVQCWGNNLFDQLGASTGTQTRSAVPIAVGGLCTCPGPVRSCNGQCVDTTSDPHNCGGCDNLCSGGTCVASSCQCSDPARPTMCPPSGSSHVCTDTNSDPKNCGSCGHTCSTGETCSNGVCVCAPGLTMCGGRCVDLQSDNANCGRCGIHCRNQQGCNREESGCTACENGECEPF